MSICMPAIVHTLILTAMTVWKMLQDMDGEDLQECHSLSTMLFNCSGMMVYSLLSSMPVDYVKSSVLILGSVLKLIVSILHVVIQLNYVPIATMEFKMLLGQGLRTIHKDWAAESFFLHPSLVRLDTCRSYIRMQGLFVAITAEQIFL